MKQQPPDTNMQNCDWRHYAPVVLENIPSGIVLLDITGRVLFANNAARQFLAGALKHIEKGDCWTEMPEAAPLVNVFNEVVATGVALARREVTFDIPDAGEKTLGLSASFLMEQGKRCGVVFLFTDLTELRRVERAAALTRQLATLGELTAGVVHELRNPISVISGMAELLIRKLSHHDEARNTAEVILQESVGLERAIAQFLAFARPYELERKECRPQDIGDRALQFCQRRAQQKEVSLESRYHDPLPMILVDGDRIAQALGNILSNAVDAVSVGGHVLLEVFTSGQNIVFDVLDNGPGIHLRPGDDLFAPFFTMKEGGTGLGLTIAHRIVTAHHGTITYANRKECGARFTIALPATADSELSL